VDALSPVEALRRETERFVTLIDSIGPADENAMTYNGLTVRDLVAHVAIIDEAFVASADDGSFIGADQGVVLTEAELPGVAGWSFGQICDRFRRARRALVDLDAQPSADVRVGGYSLSSALIIRAFETWTHHDDIVVALGRVELFDEAPVLRTMAELAVQTLPVALAARGYDYPGCTARIVMTGPGGGDWTIAMKASETAGPVPHVVIRVPVVEFCRRFADRLAVDDVPFQVEGDADLARALVDAAPAFAGL